MSEQTPAPDVPASPVASGAPDQRWMLLTGYDGHSIQVPEHNDANRLEAARLLAEGCVGGDPTEVPTALARLASVATAVTYRQHVSEQPSDVGCGCEEDDGTWWCPDGDGPETPFYSFDRSDIAKYEDDADMEVPQ